jgi:putative transposase
MRRKGKQVGLEPAPGTTVPDIDARVALIQALIPVALDQVLEELQADVDQKLPIEVPRVRDQHRQVEVPLPTYERLQQPRSGDTGLLDKVMERRLDGYDLVARLLDGKTFAEDEMVTAVGVTITGEKILLGFVQTATENRKACAAFLCELVERGLQIEAGLLVVTDGAKGLHAAVREVYGAAALLQRCQWHKRENVLQYLSERHRPTFRRKLQAAYMSGRSMRPPSARSANCAANSRSSMPQRRPVWTPGRDPDAPSPRRLRRTRHELEDDEHPRVNPRARRKPHCEGRSLEEQRTEQRWLATALLDLEPRLRRVRNYHALPLLREAIKRQMQGAKKSAA